VGNEHGSTPIFGDIANKVLGRVDDVASKGGAKNVANYAKLKEFYKTSETANPLVESLKNTGRLPSNYITKAQAEALGWQPGKALGNHAPGNQIGGDIFRDDFDLLPSESGRVWYEADIGLTDSIKRSKQPGTRLLYANDGQMYITSDHYGTFQFLGTYK
jgi:filamentous hemagglutinin